jgi:sulfite exporter TauE/SafE/copper chaperone CopZ
MTCVNCENRIERRLSETNGIVSVKVSYSKGNAVVSYDPGIISYEQIVSLIEELDYHVKRRTQRDSKKVDIPNLIATAAIIITLIMLISHFGGFNIFNKFPVAKEGTGYAMLLIIGLLTSVHCVAMCGGICISQCAPKNAASGNLGKLATLRPSILYNLGRVISYTVIGGIVGAIGSVVSFSGPMRGIVQILAGIFMVIMGINMLNLFPFLRRFNPRMPKVFAKKINAEKRSNSPFYVGLLNGLMPCGPLQAMQLYALSTGSPIKGAISMFLFSIGTVPLMFAFGALSSLLSKKFTKKMMSVSAVMVVILGVFMFTNGASLSGIAIPAPVSSAQTTKNVATLQNGVQTVTITLSSGKYEPIVVQKGIPVKWIIQADSKSINGCNNSIVVPKYNIQQDLKPGDNVIEFTPSDSGTFPYSCWMGMIRSKITVVDDLKNIDQKAIDQEPSNSDNAGLPSCCGGGAGGYGGSYGGSGSGSGANNLLLPDVPADKVAVAEIKDGVQNVKITLDKNGFSPAIVVMQKGVKTNWVINGESAGTGSNVLFPLYYAQIAIQEGDNKITLIPDQDFNFYTQDNKFAGYVKVVDDIKSADINAIKKEIKAYNKN